MASRPLVLPEPFSDEGSWESWLYQFESVVDVNNWDDGKKLKWLKVRLTGKAQTAFQRLPEEARANYKEAKKALQERFEPKSPELFPRRITDPYKTEVEVVGGFC